MRTDGARRSRYQERPLGLGYDVGYGLSLSHFLGRFDACENIYMMISYGSCHDYFPPPITSLRVTLEG